MKPCPYCHGEGEYIEDYIQQDIVVSLAFINSLKGE